MSRPSSRLQLSSGNPIDVRAVGQIADPESQHQERPVVEPDRQDPLAEDLERDPGSIRMNWILGTNPARPVLRPVLERIGEDAPDAILGLLLAEDRHGPADPLGEEPGVVEAEQVVGVIVRVGDGVDPTDPLAEELDPHLGRGVDQQVPGRKAEQARSAGCAGSAGRSRCRRGNRSPGTGTPVEVPVPRKINRREELSGSRSSLGVSGHP